MQIENDKVNQREVKTESVPYCFQCVANRQSSAELPRRQSRTSAADGTHRLHELAELIASVLEITKHVVTGTGR